MTPPHLALFKSLNPKAPVVEEVERPVSSFYSTGCKMSGLIIVGTVWLWFCFLFFVLYFLCEVSLGVLKGANTYISFHHRHRHQQQQQQRQCWTRIRGFGKYVYLCQIQIYIYSLVIDLTCCSELNPHPGRHRRLQGKTKQRVSLYLTTTKQKLTGQQDLTLVNGTTEEQNMTGWEAQCTDTEET